MHGCLLGWVEKKNKKQPSTEKFNCVSFISCVKF